MHPHQQWQKIQDIISRVGGDGSRNVFLSLTADHQILNRTSEFQDLKAGDVVLVIQPDTPRGHWPLQRIAEVYPGCDGRTHVAEVACGVKTSVRPIN